MLHIPNKGVGNLTVEVYEGNSVVKVHNATVKITGLILQVIFAIILGPPAFMSLKEFIKIRRGEELIEKQNKITQPIVQAGSLKLGGNVNNFGPSNCNHQGFHSQK